MLLAELIASGDFEVTSDHFGDEFFESGFRAPAELIESLGRIAEQGFDFGGPEIARVDFNDRLAGLQFDILVAGDDFADGTGFADSLTLPRDFDAEFVGGGIDEVAHRFLATGSNDEVVGFFLLQHQPLHFDVVAGMTPVTQRVQIAEIQAVLQPERDAGDGAGDFAGDESFAALRRFVIEKNAVAAENTVGFTVVDGDPVGVELGDGIGRAWVERRRFFLRGFLDEAVEFGSRGLVKARVLFEPENSDRFEQAQRADTVGVGRIFWRFEGNGHVALGGEVVDFVRANLLNDADQVRRVGHVAVVQRETPVVDVRILIEMIDAVSVEQR